MSLGAASAWMVIGRASGLLWTMALIFTLGIDDYGRYASAYAAAAILSAPIENIFVVRCVRVSEHLFLGERTLRVLIGSGLAAIGAAIYAASFIAGFALLIAGLEMIFNAYKSRALRDGEPCKIMRIDAVRQLSSIVIALGYILLAKDAASLAIACLWYLSPYLVIILMTLRQIRGHGPLIPKQWREQGVLVVDALVLSVYLQGDIILLGLLTNTEVVGIYSVASQLALAASTIGQLFGQQFAVAVRERPAHREAEPPMRATLGIGVLLWVGTTIVALILILFTEYHQVGWTLFAIAPFAGLRAVTNTWVTVLYIRGVDVHRIVWSAVALVMRYALIVVLVGCLPEVAAVMTALSAVVGETILTLAFFRLMRVPQSKTED